MKDNPTIAVYVDPEVKRVFRDEAKQRGMTMSDWAAEILTRELTALGYQFDGSTIPEGTQRLPFDEGDRK